MLFLNENEIPSFDKMIKPLIMALKELGGNATVKKLDAKTIEIMNPPDEMKQVMHGIDESRTEIEYRLAWARTYLKKYGLIENKSRGIWSFTNKFNGNIEDIDTLRIVRAVRNERTHLSSYDDISLNKIDSAQAFEKLIFSMLLDYGVQIPSKTEDNYFDAILPNGIGDYKEKIYCEIKYFSFETNSFRINSKIKDYLFNAAEIMDGKILLITNIVISQKTKKEILGMFSNEYMKRIIIWDRTEWIEYINPDAEYIDYLINPKQALIEESIFSKKTKKEKNELRKENIASLKESYSNHNLVLIFGAGVSIHSGIPLWGGLIKEMLVRLIQKKMDSDRLSKKQIEQLCQMAYENIDMSPLAQMRYIKIPFEDNLEEYYNLLQSVLYSSELKRDTPLLESIAKISAPRRSYKGINSIITYNFDDLIESALKNKAVEYNIVYDENSISMQDKLNIYHVHGYLPQDKDAQNFGRSLVFSEEDYHMVYKDAYSWSNLTQLNAFRENTCLFIGCSLTDPNLRRILDIASRNDEKARHYAIMKKMVLDKSAVNNSTGNLKIVEAYEELDNDLRENYFKSLGLNIIWVNEYNEIPKVLNQIYEN